MASISIRGVDGFYIQNKQVQSSFFGNLWCDFYKEDEPVGQSSYQWGVSNDEPVGQSSYQWGVSNDEPVGQSSYQWGVLNEEPVGQSSYQWGVWNEEPMGRSSYQFDLNEKPVSQCSYEFDLNKVPQVGRTTFDKTLLMEIPTFFHRYVIDIQDVIGDGNCGFRSIASSLRFGQDEWLYVCEQLLDELLSSYEAYSRVFYGIEELHTSLAYFKKPAPPRHWLLMPDTSILIANRFGVIVNYLSSRGSVTCFPLWKGPEEFSDPQTITIAHVYDNHYVMVKLEEDYPMPPILGLWIRNRAPSATGWQTMYASRLQIYKQFNPTTKEFVTIEDC